MQRNRYLTEEELKRERMKELIVEIGAGLLIAPVLYAICVFWLCI